MSKRKTIIDRDIEFYIDIDLSFCYVVKYGIDTVSIPCIDNMEWIGQTYDLSYRILAVAVDMKLSFQITMESIIILATELFCTPLGIHL